MVMIGRWLRGAAVPAATMALGPVAGVATAAGVGAYEKGKEKKKTKEAEKAQQQQQRDVFQKSILENDPYKNLEDFQKRQENLARQLREQSQVARQEAGQEFDQAFANPPQGLSDEQRRAMQERANRQIGSQTQNYIRQIAGRMGARGVRGGSVANLQREIARTGNEALGDFQRRLEEMNADQVLRKIAGRFALQEGAAAQTALDRQAAADFIKEYLQNQLQRQLAAAGGDVFYSL